MLDLHGDEKVCDLETILSLDEKVRASSVRWVANHS